MFPICNPRSMLMPVNAGMCAAAAPAMMPVMPMSVSPALCAAPQAMVPMMPMLCSTTSMMSEYDSQMYGRFHHVEREHPRYRHAPFDWYRPPKQPFDVIHEDAAVVTMDGPVPIGDFYRYYIYGDESDDYDDDYDEYDEDDSASYDSEDDDLGLPSYEQRSVGYQRYPRRRANLMDDDDDGIPPRPTMSRSSMSGRNYAPINSSRRTPTASSAGRSPAYRRNRSAAGDDDFDDAASVNSTYDT